jgi:two-component system LytT family response regulator
MRVLVVDDEAAARSRLTAMLEELDVEVVGVAENGMVAIEKAAEMRPDLVLLDIVMPEVDGFDVARHLSEPRPLIVFQTAHDEHALRAFEHEAVDYVVKPITLERLERTLDRVRRRFAGVDAGSLARGVIERLEQALGAASTPRRARLLVRDRGAHRLLPFAQVTRFTVHDGLVFAHTATGRFVVDYTLDELEARSGPAFVRCSRSDLIQLDRVARFAPNADGSAEVTLDDGTRVRVSRRRTPELRRAMER